MVGSHPVVGGVRVSLVSPQPLVVGVVRLNRVHDPTTTEVYQTLGPRHALGAGERFLRRLLAPGPVAFAVAGVGRGLGQQLLPAWDKKKKKGEII